MTIKPDSQADTVLLVDDETTMVAFLRALLEQVYHVLVAYNGAEAIREVLEHTPDLVLLDIRMPVLGGDETITEIRKFSDVPIIMISGMADENGVVDCLSRGADDYITKPFGTSELSVRVEAAIRRSRQDSYRPRSGVYIDHRLSLDANAHRLRVDGTEIKLLPSTARVLAKLVEHPNQTVLTRDLLDALGVASEDALRWHVVRLRRALGPDRIMTERGNGYRYLDR